MKTTFLLLAGLAVFAISSCAPSTPAARIAANPAAYDALPAKQQQQVSEGQIARGMSPEAVLLAWGRPSRQIEQMRAEGPVERWDYTGSRPVYVNNFYGGFGYGRYGRCGRYSGIGMGWGPEVAYVPYLRASVWFKNGKVDEWENVR